ncbi:hypothetical protein F5B17DRAFT_157951 [Nemania serpens]|nr:hypothetical protein F5B17DRAFT_157951 [Nemania serpens]
MYTAGLGTLPPLPRYLDLPVNSFFATTSSRSIVFSLLLNHARAQATHEPSAGKGTGPRILHDKLPFPIAQFVAIGTSIGLQCHKLQPPARSRHLFGPLYLSLSLTLSGLVFLSFFPTPGFGPSSPPASLPRPLISWSSFGVSLSFFLLHSWFRRALHVPKELLTSTAQRLSLMVHWSIRTGL